MEAKGFASKLLVDAVQAGDIWKANKRLQDGGRHLQLWSFMKHWDSVTKLGWGSRYELVNAHAQMGYVEPKWHGSGHTLELAPVVGYRADKARQAAIAVLGLKRRKLLSKDMSTMIAKMVYLSYENRYSEAWGCAPDWTKPVMGAVTTAMRWHLRTLGFVAPLLDIMERFFPLFVVITMIIVLF